MNSLRDALRRVTATELPAPGSGQTPRRLAALASIARDDLELARLAEAHHDAHAIATEVGANLESDALYGVWAASGPDPLIAESSGSEFRLTGTVPWCTGVGVVDRALVTARWTDDAGADTVLLFDVAIADGNEVPGAARWMSPAFATTGTSSLRFDIMTPANRVVGEPGQYLARPGFWHGAICVSACWAGGVRGLLDDYERCWQRTDPHALAHLGSAAAWVDALDAVLAKAGDAIDEDPSSMSCAESRARGVRHVVERTCIQVMDDLGVGAGPQPLAFDREILERTQQLQLYIRQFHGERDLEPLGRSVMERSRRSPRL